MCHDGPLAFLNIQHEGSSDTNPEVDDGRRHQHAHALHQIAHYVDERGPHAAVAMVTAALRRRRKLVGSVTVAVRNARLMEDQRHPTQEARPKSPRKSPL